MGVGRLYSLVVVLFRLHNFETKLLVEIDCRLVTDLHMAMEREREQTWHEVQRRVGRLIQGLHFNEIRLLTQITLTQAALLQINVVTVGAIII